MFLIFPDHFWNDLLLGKINDIVRGNIRYIGCCDGNTYLGNSMCYNSNTYKFLSYITPQSSYKGKTVKYTVSIKGAGDAVLYAKRNIGAA